MKLFSSSTAAKGTKAYLPAAGVKRFPTIKNEPTLLKYLDQLQNDVTAIQNHYKSGSGFDSEEIFGQIIKDLSTRLKSGQLPSPGNGALFASSTTASDERWIVSLSDSFDSETKEGSIFLDKLATFCNAHGGFFDESREAIYMNFDSPLPSKDKKALMGILKSRVDNGEIERVRY